MLKDYFKIKTLLLLFSILATYPAFSDSKPYIVVLDPGHGGQDKGAIGLLNKKAIFEKDIALGIAIRAGRYLKNPKYTKALNRPIKVLFTRTRDQDVSLEARSELARSSEADLFVSIHSNSESTKTVSGFETYFLNNTDKSAALKLEEIENRSSKKYAGKAAEDLVIRSVAADAVVDASREAAELLHHSIVDHLKLVDFPPADRGVKQALLYVLLDAQTPAVLLEALFLSHPRDLAFLNQGENRDKIAEGLAKGILRFLATR